jgi:histidinol-phosphatase (PHP family)
MMIFFIYELKRILRRTIEGMPVTTDFHNHLSFTSAEAMIQTARQRELRVFGLSEHVFQISEIDPILAHLPREGRIISFEAYRSEIQAAAQKERIDVRMGLEVDFDPMRNAMIQAPLRKYAWDFLIGSVHDVDELHFDRMTEDPGRERGEALWLRYFELLRAAVTSGYFQVVSHPVRMYTTNHYLPTTFDDELEHLAAEATRCNVALELNGFDVETYPAIVRRLMKACALQHTPISCGSDAHWPNEIGRSHEQITAILREADIQKVRIWKQQEPEDYQL